MRVPISELIYRSGLGRIIGRRYQGRGVIFMLHSIVDDPAAYLNDPLRCTPAVLERALRWARAQGLDIVSLDEAVHRLRSKTGGRFVVFTFDDGYRDNITKALPLMARYGAPMTVYVTTGMITREMFAWWDGLVMLFRSHDDVDLEPMGRRFLTSDLRSKSDAVKAVKAWIHQDGSRAEGLRHVFLRYQIDIRAELDGLGMSLDELRQASRNPLLTFAGHTESHPFLTLLNETEVRREMLENKRFLEHETQRSIRYFAYPYGDAGTREAEIAEEVGFLAAVTTDSGTLFTDHASAGVLHELPREAIDSNDTVGCLECRQRGVYRFIKTRSGDPVARL
jgi:peptidoglycan/xylan/chitin deacetylase (PgdA/CDA1 family)